MRINDRGPYGNDRVISLSRAADRPSEYLQQHQSAYRTRSSSPGMVHCRPGMAPPRSQSKPMPRPARPDLSGGGMGSMPAPSDAGQPQGDIRPISNSTLKAMIQPVRQ